MSKNIILTIGVPIYNEEKYLEKTLISLEEIKFDEIEILISDNNSSDRSKEIIKEFENRLVNFRFLEHSNNIGASLNMQSIFENASGKYVWLIGGGEVVYSDKIDKLLAILNTGRYSNLVLNHDSFDEKNKILRKSKESKDRILDGANEPQNSFAFAIASNVISKFQWLSNSSNNCKYWIHIEKLFVIFFSSNYSGTIYLGDKYYILSQNAINGWYNSKLSYLPHLQYLTILKYNYITRNSLAFFKLYVNELGYSLFNAICIARKNGLKVDKAIIYDFQKIIPLILFPIYQPFFYLPLIFVKVFKLKFWFNFIFKLINKRKKIYFFKYAEI
jgi:glycosyltransferase involved in cell wall biosynthesis